MGLGSIQALCQTHTDDNSVIVAFSRILCEGKALLEVGKRRAIWSWNDSRSVSEVIARPFAFVVPLAFNSSPTGSKVTMNRSISQMLSFRGKHRLFPPFAPSTRWSLLLHVHVHVLARQPLPQQPRIFSPRFV